MVTLVGILFTLSLLFLSLSGLSTLLPL